MKINIELECRRCGRILVPPDVTGMKAFLTKTSNFVPSELGMTIKVIPCAYCLLDAEADGKRQEA